MYQRLKNYCKYFDRHMMVNKTDSSQLEEQVNTLKSQGFYVFNNLLTPEQLKSLQADYQTELTQKLNMELPCLAQTKIDPVTHKDMIENFWRYHPEQLAKRSVTFDQNDFKNYNEVVEKFKPSTLKTYLPSKKNYYDLWLHPQIMDLVEAYMGLRPYLVEAYLRRNYPAQYKVMNHFWHRDTNHKTYLLKAFFFFSDCEVEHGPHEYIAGSVNDRRLDGRVYYTDEEVDQLYPVGSKERIRSIVKAGTVIVEDTRGLHRAMNPVSGYRDLGYAVFFPKRMFSQFEKEYFTIERKIYEQLSERQKSYISPRFVV